MHVSYAYYLSLINTNRMLTGLHMSMIFNDNNFFYWNCVLILLFL